MTVDEDGKKSDKERAVKFAGFPKAPGRFAGLSKESAPSMASSAVTNSSDNNNDQTMSLTQLSAKDEVIRIHEQMMKNTDARKAMMNKSREFKGDTSESSAHSQRKQRRGSGRRSEDGAEEGNPADTAGPRFAMSGSHSSKWKDFSVVESAAKFNRQQSGSSSGQMSKSPSGITGVMSKSPSGNRRGSVLSTNPGDNIDGLYNYKSTAIAKQSQDRNYEQARELMEDLEKKAIKSKAKRPLTKLEKRWWRAVILNVAIDVFIFAPVFVYCGFVLLADDLEMDPIAWQLGFGMVVLFTAFKDAQMLTDSINWMKAWLVFVVPLTFGHFYGAVRQFLWVYGDDWPCFSGQSNYKSEHSMCRNGRLLVAFTAAACYLSTSCFILWRWVVFSRGVKLETGEIELEISVKELLENVDMNLAAQKRQREVEDLQRHARMLRGPDDQILNLGYEDEEDDHLNVFKMDEFPKEAAKAGLIAGKPARARKQYSLNPFAGMQTKGAMLRPSSRGSSASTTPASPLRKEEEEEERRSSSRGEGGGGGGGILKSSSPIKEEEDSPGKEKRRMRRSLLMPNVRRAQSVAPQSDFAVTAAQVVTQHVAEKRSSIVQASQPSISSSAGVAKSFSAQIAESKWGGAFAKKRVEAAPSSPP